MGRKRRYEIEKLESRRLLSSVLTVGYTPGTGPTGPVPLDSTPPGGAHESEMAIAVDPTNPLNIAATSIANPTQSQLVLGSSTGIDEWWSTDGGASWQVQNFPYNFDPSIAYDASGNLFLSCLGGPGLVVLESTDKGANFATAGQIADDVDKDWLTTGPDPNNTSGNGLAVYLGYDNGFNGQTIHVAGWQETSSGTLNALSFRNDTLTFSPGVTASGDFVDPVVGPHGELYAAWSNTNSIFISRALNGLWGAAPVFDVTPQAFGLRQGFSESLVDADPNRGIFTGPTMGVDSDPASPYFGQLYLAYADAPPGSVSPVGKGNSATVIDLLRTDNPDATSPTWNSTPIQIDPATGASEFLPALSVDPTTGAVNVLYYSSASTGNIAQVVPRLATSIDGGGSWSLRDMSSTPSDMGAYDATNNDRVYVADYMEYIGLSAYGGTARAVYASTDNVGSGTTYTMGVHAYFASATVAAQVTSAANFTLATSTGGTNLTVTGSGGTLLTTPIASISTIRAQVAGVLTIDPANGNPISPGGISDNGGGTGTLEVEVHNNSDISSLASASLGFRGNPVGYANLASLALDIVGGTFAPTFDVGAVAGAPVTINDSSAVTFPAGYDQHLAALNIASGAIASMTAIVMPLLPTLYVASLSIAADGSGNPLGTLDLGKSQMLLTYGASADPMPSVFKYLQSGYAGGAWTGHGIITSGGAANTTHNTVIGYADHDDGHGGASINPANNSILLRYAVFGNATLNGTVNANDYSAVVRNFGTGTTWDQGDFNYNGAADAGDYATVVRNFGLSLYGLTVAPQSAFTAAAGAHEFAVADLNGDGIPDLVLSDYSDNSVVVLLGNGNGTFRAPATYAVGTHPIGIAIADLNGDGKPDVVVSNWSSGNVSVLLGNGDGTFKPQKTFDAGLTALSVAVADVNGDGKPDIVVGNYNWGFDGIGYGSITVLLGNGDGTFASTPLIPTLDKVNSVVIADINGDGKLDIVYTSRSTNTVDVLFGNGDGTFPYYLPTYTDAAPWSVAVADMNGDGKPDLIVGDLNGTVSVLLGNGNGTFLPQQTFAAGSGPFTSPTEQVVVADLNGDGALDLIVTNGNSNAISVLLGNGNGTFQAAQTLAVGNSPWAVAVADINGDGKPDIVVINYADSTISVLLNTTTF